MRRSELLRLLRSRLQIMQLMQSNFGVKDLMVFGSAARDEAGPKSDVDLLVEFKQQPNFDRFMDLKLFLEDVLKMPLLQ